MPNIKNLIIGITALLSFTSAAQNNYKHFYIGTYTDSAGKGIYLYKMNSETGEIDFVNVTENIVNPSYIAIDKSNNYLYAINEVANFDDLNSGSVSAFKIDADKKN